MRHLQAAGALFGGLVMSLATTSQSAAQPAPPPADVYLPAAHSHNDYDRVRPLLGAVSRGFASVEVDVALVSGVLHVAHAIDEVQPAVTLERLYLDPLREIARRNGGWIYGPTVPPLQLLIDVKSEADETYRALDGLLATYSDILTSWAGDEERPGPVVAVLSGNRAVRLIQEDPLRFVSVDGRVSEPRAEHPVNTLPLVSHDWDDLQASSASDRLAEARDIVQALHREGRKVRFWGTPDREHFWALLASIDVDYIGTDDPDRLERYLRESGAVVSLGARARR